MVKRDCDLWRLRPARLGSATARLLRARGHELHLVGRNKEKLAPLSAGFTVGDVCEKGLFSQVTEDFAAPWDGFVYCVETISQHSHKETIPLRLALRTTQSRLLGE